MKQSLAMEQMDQDWDLVVIGGGITGAGVLREAVRNGFHALLVEQRDFAWGTSSRSSKLVHGGLRYLKEGNFKLTRESIIERERLLKEAPGLVRSLEFLLPIYQGKKPGKWAMEAGLAIYDMLSGKWRHRFFDKDIFLQKEPLVDNCRLMGGFSFLDAQVDDARLVLRLIKEAEAHGAMALNYTRAMELLRSDTGEIKGLRIEDSETHEQKEIRTRLVINATGAWAETLHPSPEKNQHLRPLRGSHLIFPRDVIPLGTTVSFFNPEDGRALFAIPWEGAVLVGTTDIDHLSPLSMEPSITRDEADYLIKGLKTVFPSLDLSLSMAISSFSGVRPVVSEGKVAADKESREHVIWHDKGLVTVTGGKLTTFRSLAWDTLHAALAYLPVRKLQGRNEPVFDRVSAPVISTALSEEATRVLYGRYGMDAGNMIRRALPEDLEYIPGTQTLWAELPQGASQEKIRHLDDLLLRRVRIGLLLKDGGRMYMDRIRTYCEPALDWDPLRWEKEIEDYFTLWQNCYSLPKKDGQ
ncbi:MAG: glycerol-3-phosphate dehydrogenase/oxidase [Proteobacteria bacterium]|nr:glycerol-3-phosphate dehydrogenase/oxidase [Pseudomonadota bacterium]